MLTCTSRITVKASDKPTLKSDFNRHGRDGWQTEASREGRERVRADFQSPFQKEKSEKVNCSVACRSEMSNISICFRYKMCNFPTRCFQGNGWSFTFVDKFSGEQVWNTLLHHESTPDDNAPCPVHTPESQEVTQSSKKWKTTQTKQHHLLVKVVRLKIALATLAWETQWQMSDKTACWQSRRNVFTSSCMSLGGIEGIEKPDTLYMNVQSQCSHC